MKGRLVEAIARLVYEVTPRLLHPLANPRMQLPESRPQPKGAIIAPLDNPLLRMMTQVYVARNSRQAVNMD
jgi:hypothetical protein